MEYEIVLGDTDKIICYKPINPNNKYIISLCSNFFNGIGITIIDKHSKSLIGNYHTDKPIKYVTQILNRITYIFGENCIIISDRNSTDLVILDTILHSSFGKLLYFEEDGHKKMYGLHLNSYNHKKLNEILTSDIDKNISKYIVRDGQEVNIHNQNNLLKSFIYALYVIENGTNHNILNDYIKINGGNKE